LPAPIAVVASGTAKTEPPLFSPDELFFFALLNSLPRLTVCDRQRFLHEVCANFFYNTDELPKQNL
jgi:hypothetical protein